MAVSPKQVEDYYITKLTKPIKDIEKVIDAELFDAAEKIEVNIPFAVNRHLYPLLCKQIESLYKGVGWRNVSVTVTSEEGVEDFLTAEINNTVQLVEDVQEENRDELYGLLTSRSIY